MKFHFSTRNLSLILFFFSFLSIRVQSQDSEYSTKKNVILIMVDDLNDWISIYGDKYSNTPNISRLAEKGSIFTNAWPTVPLCNPSRVSIMTGIHPLTSGVVSNGQYPFREHLPNAKTLIQEFKDNGYYTKGLGKIFHKEDDLNEDWDAYDRFSEIPAPATFPAHGIEALTNENKTRDWAAIDADLREWGDYLITEEALRFLKSHNNNTAPFFLAIGYRLPHFPWYYPAQFDDKFDAMEIPLPNDTTIGQSAMDMHNLITENKLWEDAIKAYLSSVSFIDYNIGLVIDLLESNDLHDSSLVVFMSDHGFHLGEKSRWTKNTIWNESLRTPLIILEPSIDHQPRVIDQHVNLIDLYPTIMDLCKIQPNKFVDGSSISYLLHGESDQLNDVNYSTQQFGHIAFASKEYKYVKIGDFNAVFDMNNDFEELNPIYEDSLNGNFENMLATFQNGFQIYSSIDSAPELVVVNSDNSEKTLELSWSPTSTRESYEIQLFINGEKEARVWSYEENSSFKYSWSNCDTLIEARIRSSNPKYQTAWSDLVSFHFDAPAFTNVYDEKNEFVIYPNPTTDGFTVKETYDQEVKSVSILAVNGMKLMEFTYQPEMTYPIPDLPNGFYFVFLEVGDNYVLGGKIMKMDE